jgi:23S rRNA (cytidine1920-2'-O)/16S rRNA (cytidine1409-2'-O)-methyltransferase
LLAADLSFTSLVRLAPVFFDLVEEQGHILTLVKPQFELPKEAVEGGVVRSFDLHVQAVDAVLAAFAQRGMAPQGASFSHILGPKGNIEFWIWALKHGVTATIDVSEVVRRAHKELAEGATQR